MDDTIGRLKMRDEGLLPFALGEKYRKMTRSVYHFFRGSCPLFYDDLSALRSLPSSPFVWICGDLHTENLGTFETADKKIHFDLNDFDEAALGPALWETARFICSIYCAGHTAGLSRELCRQLASAVVEEYRRVLISGVDKDLSQVPAPITQMLQEAEGRKKSMLLRKRTDDKKKLRYNQRQLPVSAEHRSLLLPDMAQWLSRQEAWKNFEPLDICFRLAGLGSLGQQRYLLLAENKTDKEQILLDFKESRGSSLVSCLPDQPLWHNESERIRQVQQRCQQHSPMLQTFSYGDSYFMVQELQPQKQNFRFLKKKKNFSDLQDALCHMAGLSALSQLRSCGWQGAAGQAELRNFADRGDWENILLETCVELYECTLQRFESFASHHIRLLPVADTL